MPSTVFKVPERYEYQNGLGSHPRIHDLTRDAPGPRLSLGLCLWAPTRLRRHFADCTPRSCLGQLSQFPDMRTISPGCTEIMPAAAHQSFELCNDQLAGHSSQGHFQLPELGPIGSNCLANARDFQAPITDYQSPFDVVAWHGNFYSYKYDLGRFNTIGSISYDHPDPKVVSSRSWWHHHLPWRWLVAENTFRPPLASSKHHVQVYGPD